MVYIDNFDETGIKYGRMKMCHMIADTRQELLEMCDKIGVQRKWIQEYDKQREHFDISINKKKLAIKNGAKLIDMRELATIVKGRDLKKYLENIN